MLRSVELLARRVLPEAFRRRLRALRGVSSTRLTDYDRNLLMNPVLADAEATDIALSIGYPAWGLLYYVALTSRPLGRPSITVETGTNHGYSTIVLAQAIEDGGDGGVVHTIDQDPDCVERARRNVERAGLMRYVRFHQGDSVEVLAGLGLERIDFAFLDAGHDLDSVIGEFSAIHNRVSHGGTVYFDNTTEGGVSEALDQIVRTYPGQLVELPNCSWHPPGNAIWQPAGRRSGRPGPG